MTFHTKLLVWAQYHCLDGFPNIYDRIRYLVSFSYLYDEICK